MIIHNFNFIDVYCFGIFTEPIAQTIELILKNEEVISNVFEYVEITDLNGNTIKLLDEIAQVSQYKDLKPGVYIIEVIPIVIYTIVRLYI